MNSHCSQCPRKNKLLQPSGPSDARVLALSESPGVQEDNKGEIFIGRIGDELNRGYLPLGGLRRDDIAIQNTVCCFPTTYKGKLDTDRAADAALIDSCFYHNTLPIIERMQPKIILGLGALACRSLDPTIDLELDHGIPRWSDDFNTWIFPMYHPALGMYEPKKMLHLRNDWSRLKKFRHGKLRVVKDKYEGFEDYQHLDAEGVTITLDGMEDRVLACDTETTKKGSPFCLTYSVQPGTGYLIRADDREALEVFQSYLDRWDNYILFHNWLFDERVVKAMGLRFPRKRMRDTMVMTFHQGNIPQGLKPISYRELGMKMQDFTDLVGPYSKELVLDYYRQGWMEEWEKPPYQMVMKDGELKKYQPQSIKQKLRRFFGDYEKNPDKDVFKMWHENWEEQHDEFEGKLGEWPGMCITHVPFERVIHYACRDSDSLGRYYPILRRAIARTRKYSQENWREAA